MTRDKAIELLKKQIKAEHDAEQDWLDSRSPEDEICYEREPAAWREEQDLETIENMTEDEFKKQEKDFPELRCMECHEENPQLTHEFCEECL